MPAHPVLISFLSRVTTYLLDLVLFDFLLPESGIHYLSASANLSHFLLTYITACYCFLVSVTLWDFGTQCCSARNKPVL